MKVIKQLSENEFVIKMEDCDLEKESRMTIAHDYVQFGANMGLTLDPIANWRPTGKFAGAFSNWIRGYFHVQKNMITTMELTDGYKLDHRRQYPEGTEFVYSNWTPRSNSYFPEAEDGCVVFGIQYFINRKK